MHIGLIAPFSSEDVPSFFSGPSGSVPLGYRGAPFIASIALELVSRNFEVTIFTTDSALIQSPKVYERDGLRVVFCPSRSKAWRFNGRRPGRIVDLFSFERSSLLCELKRYSPDVVHAHWAYEFALSAIASDIPAVVSLHDSPKDIFFHTKSIYRLLRWAMALRVMARDVVFTAPSPYLFNRLKLLSRRCSRVVPNPVCELAFSLGYMRPAPVSRRIAVVCNGWSRLKNPQAALRAFGIFNTIFPSSELHFFGVGFEEDGVGRKWAKKNDLDRGCFFHGPLENNRLIVALSELDVLMHTSREESFGVVIAEAMALGLPVVAGERSGAVPWVMGDTSAEDSAGDIGLSDVAGVLVDVESPVSISDGLGVIFSRNYEKYSSFGYKRSRELFSRSAVVDGYLESYALALE